MSRELHDRVGDLFSRARRFGANLSSADLYNTKLDNAELRRADLRRATLVGADLRKAHFDSTTRLEEAIYDFRTLWPDGFDATSAGAKVQDYNL